MSNSVNWFEIPVHDLERGMAFYAAMTGKPLKKEAFGAPGEEMAIFQPEGNDPQAVHGALLKSPHNAPSNGGTMVYLNAEPSIDAWLNRVAGAGGSIVTPKTALPEGMGFFAHIVDSEGNRVGLHAMA
jgi:uncharacterized protein